MFWFFTFFFFTITSYNKDLSEDYVKTAPIGICARIFIYPLVFLCQHVILDADTDNRK